jgi:hypothetical protein
MQKRQITLEDGRYLIFYTFEEAPAPAEEKHGAAASAPKAEPEAEEERRV